ncbi:uncharacterized protein B0J16DRAFT_177605 [Fusarium flagelliforme]|uniref:Transcription factor aceii n=1 Tax=Fusarium flagelliforme TaxID=2675880 RepID=A0A395N0V7_9HYPO|nr:uncharacterized protein B0J16DRAFT_177605 [Fusarium flagelliforme]KAH7179805.1 hypothetical protein B0J16DRAFT_177605 [Fusarium flagelliforme]RFN53771.1 transcription factor aceii [Fusarium flagelliforme]
MTDLRQACDRCHSKKLRCTKIPASSVCARCVKAGVTCVFSPPTRSLRHPDNVGFDWSILGLGQEVIDPQSISVDHLIATPPTNDNADQPPSAQVTLVPQLTDLMAAFDRMHNNYSTLKGQHLTMRDLNDLSKFCGFDLGPFLEELLQRSQKLVNLYPQVLKRLRPKETEPCNTPDCVHNSHLFSNPRHETPVDESLIHLLLACHLRLLDLFDNMINHGRMCAHAAPLLPPGCEPRLDIPEIKIGSFVAPKISAASMMVAMLLETQACLNVKAQELHDAVTSSVGHDARAAKILGLQCESLKEHASTTSTDLRSLRDHLQELGIIG